MEGFSEIQRLMLDACIASSDEVQAKFVKAWEEKVVMDELDYSCLRLCPLFMYRNQLAGIETRYDKRLKVIYKHWWLRTEHILHQLKLVHAAFVGAGIQPVMLKGISVMFYYPMPMLRTMADFDLMIPYEDMPKALRILKTMGYAPDQAMEVPMRMYPLLVRDFTHSIECVHEKTETRFDLHWRVGNLCSYTFTSRLLLHTVECSEIAGAKRPSLAYELCMTIIHAVVSGNRDNLNWLPDVHVLNTMIDDACWQEARKIALDEKKEAIFDDGCRVLIGAGIYVPFPPWPIGRKRRVFLSNAQVDAQKKNFVHYMVLRSKNYALIMENLFPHSGTAARCYEGVRRIFLFFVFRGIIRD